MTRTPSYIRYGRTPSIWIACHTAERLNLADAFRTWSENGYGRNVRRTPKFIGVGADLFKGLFEPDEIDDPENYDYRYFSETDFYTVSLGGKKVAVADTRDGWIVDETLTDVLKDAGII